jgi:hypothetical protein
MKALLAIATTSLVLLLQGCVAVPLGTPSTVSLGGYSNYGAAVYATSPTVAAPIYPRYTVADVVAAVEYASNWNGRGYRDAWRSGRAGYVPYGGNVSGAAVYDFYRWHVQSTRYWNRMH